MFFMKFLIPVCGILRLESLLMECSCIAPLKIAMIVTMGFVFHPWFRMFSIRGSYLTCFCAIACSWNLSWQ